MSDLGKVFSWDDIIEDDGKGGGGFILLPEGDYNFVVTGFERGYYNGSAKIPACPQATVTLQITAPEGVVEVQDRLFLCQKFEWKLSAFFRAIGQKQHGQRLQMNWNAVTGALGRCHINDRKFMGRDGSEKHSNNVAYYYDYLESNFEDSDYAAKLTEIDDGEIPF